MHPTRPHRPARSLLFRALASALLLPLPAMAAETTGAAGARTTDLDEVVVTATPLRGSTEQLAIPVEVLSGEELDRRKAGTLGDTVSKLTGVQTT
jgi:iron complex outermembrane receptor protein